MLSFRVFARYQIDWSRRPLAVASTRRGVRIPPAPNLSGSLIGAGFPASQKPSIHSTLFLSIASGLFCTMDACNPFPFNCLRTLSIAMGVCTPSFTQSVPRGFTQSAFGEGPRLHQAATFAASSQKSLEYRRFRPGQGDWASFFPVRTTDRRPQLFDSLPLICLPLQEC
jgi:hypothetical protein